MSGSEAFVLRQRGHHHLSAAEVPEGRHVEGHVGEDHHVLEEGEQGVDWWGGQTDGQTRVRRTHDERQDTSLRRLDSPPSSQYLLWRLKK